MRENMDNHIIKRQVIEIDVDDRKKANEYQDRIRDFFYERVLPKLEEVFDRECPPGVVIRLDSLLLDLGDLIPDRMDMAWEEGLEDRVVERVRDALLYGGHKIELPQATVSIELLRTFLETGNLPWWQPGVESPDKLLLSVLEEAPNEVRAWLLAGRLPIAVAERLTSQFRYSTWLVLMEHLTGTEIYIIRKLVDGMAAAYDEPETVKQLVTRLVVNNPGMVPSLGVLGLQTIEHMVALTGLMPDLDKYLPELAEALGPGWQQRVARIPEEEAASLGIEPLDPQERYDEEQESAEEPEELFVENSGAILLWPFLEELFINLRLLHGPTFISADYRSRSVRLVHFLVTGREVVPEYELALPKVLCGHPISEPLTHFSGFTAAEKEECNVVLEAMIEHWTALKNTSTEGLQATFLQRSGRLSEDYYGWNLKVQREAFDLLLDRIPWNINEVALPWMQQKLYVEW